MERALALYEKLLLKYGPQHWWPADSQYEIVVGALLTQNTNWKSVEKAIANMKAARALSPRAVLETPAPELETLIRPSGFYRQKAARLKALTEKYCEILARGTPPTRDELLEVKGVGKETADSILLYAFSLPFFVVDAYTRRFCAHHRLCSCKEYDDYRDYFESRLPRDATLFNEYHALIVEWGKRQAIAKKQDGKKKR